MPMVVVLNSALNQSQLEGDKPCKCRLLFNVHVRSLLCLLLSPSHTHRSCRQSMSPSTTYTPSSWCLSVLPSPSHTPRSCRPSTLSAQERQDRERIRALTESGLYSPTVKQINQRDIMAKAKQLVAKRRQQPGEGSE